MGPSPQLGVLILAYTYPPRGGVGGFRALRLAESLVARGWRVSVLTAKGGPSLLRDDPDRGRIPGVEVLETPYTDRAAWFRIRLHLGGPTPARDGVAVPQDTPRRTRSALWLAARALLLFPDEHIGWRSGATKEGLRRIAEGGIDVIVSTSPPETAHLIAQRLHLATGIPWVADFRDPWSFSHMRPPSVFDRLHSWVEARTLRDVDVIVTVTEGWSRQFERLYPNLRHEVIPNGYQEERAPRAAPRPSPTFRLVYTGKLDEDDQDPTPLFLGVAESIRRQEVDPERIRLTFHCYGTNLNRLLGPAQSLGLGRVFQWGGTLSAQAAAEAQRNAEALLLLTWKADPSRVPAKLFDYLGAGRPILCIGRRDGEAATIIQQTGQGICVDSPAECHRVVVDWYNAWQNNGRLELTPDPGAVEANAFSRRADHYDRLLRGLVGPGGPT